MRRPVAGFTLLEVLLATALLAAAMALAFATVRAAGATIERGEAIAARNERIRAVSGFLRQRIGGARGIVFELDPASGQAKRFQGEARRMRFVADLPDYLGRGGPHLHELLVAADGSLRVSFRMVLAGRTVIARTDRPPEPLAAGLRRVEFAYRSTGKDGAPGEWGPLWPDPQGLPLQVRVRISDALGPWPELVVELPMAASDGVGDGL
jgi:general secretion pathway protein J